MSFPHYQQYISILTKYSAVVAFPTMSSTKKIDPDCKGDWEETSVRDHSRDLARQKIDNNARSSKNSFGKNV